MFRHHGEYFIFLESQYFSTEWTLQHIGKIAMYAFRACLHLYSTLHLRVINAYMGSMIWLNAHYILLTYNTKLCHCDIIRTTMTPS